MRILMLNYEYPPLGGGASPITGALAEQLALAGHTVDVVTMGYKGLPAREEHVAGRLRVLRVPALRASPVRASTPEMASYLLSALPLTLKLIASQRYDLIHAHFLIPTGALAALLKRLTGLPLVVTIHGSDVPGYNPDRFTGGHRLFAPLWRQIVASADAIVSPSQHLAQLLQRSAPAPVTIIPYGFQPPVAQSAPRRQRILFASRLFPRKGAQHLLQALAGIDLRGWEVVIAGDGPLLAELQAQARQLGIDVQFPGFVKGQALLDLYASSAIFVFPSLHDNFPVVLLEALSAGCAVITNNVTGMPEVVGEAGVLVPPTDIAALRAAISSLMADEARRAELGALARERVAAFGWDGILAQHVALYARVAATEPAVSAPRTLSQGFAAAQVQPQDAFDPSVTVALITYNSAAYIDRCLETLEAALPTGAAVLVIDNASSDDTVERVRRHPACRLVELRQNIGHSAACNLALQLAASSWVLFLDHDTYVPQGWLAPLLEAARAAWPATAMVGSRAVLVQQGRIHHDGGFAHVVGHMTLNHGFLPLEAAPAGAGEVWEVGAQASTSLLVHRERALACGGFDARYFIYLNDFELSLRMRLRGWRCYTAPDSLVYHLQGNAETSWRGKGDYPQRRAQLIYRNRWLTILKLYQTRTLLLCAPIILLYDLLLLAAALRKGWLKVYLRALGDVVRMRGAIRTQRRHIQSTRVISDRELLSAHGLSFVPGLVQSKAERTAQRSVEWLTAQYWRLVAPLLEK
ncbi:MAG: glycosyltransferase [Oscillochloris sp.]|nr:glycosyltransferase [Oscillochloris sp.]